MEQRVEDGRLIRHKPDVNALKSHLEFIGWSLKTEVNGSMTLLDQRGGAVGWQYSNGVLRHETLDYKGRDILVVSFRLEDCVLGFYGDSELVVSAYNYIAGVKKPSLEVFVTFRNPDNARGT